MNLQQIDFVLASYRRTLSEEAQKRLGFFRGLWDIQQVFENAAKVSSGNISLPPTVAELDQMYWDPRPVFTLCPVHINQADLENCVKQLTRYVIEHGGLEEQTLLALSSADWAALIGSSDLELAGKDPQAWLDSLADTLPCDTAAIICAMALRALLEPAQTLVAANLEKRLIDEVHEHNKSMCCPVCGSEPSLAYVGTTKASQGNGRRLYCAQCGHMWEFERIRCSHCGEVNPTRLHYLHTDADQAHRIQTCDACGNYLRTVYVENNSLVPFIPEVEDVVMVTLDALVQSGALEDRVKKGSSKETAVPVADKA